MLKTDAWALYDAECAPCAAGIHRLEALLRRRGIEASPLQAPWVAKRLGMTRAELLGDFRILTADGRVFIGSDGYRFIMRRVWWAWPLLALVCLPGLRQMFDSAYRCFRDNRYCVAGACALPRKRIDPAAWLPLVALPLMAVALTWDAPPWAMMWSVAFSIFVACKWLTWCEADHTAAPLSRSLGYLLLWPGMNPREFFDRNADVVRPQRHEWLAAAMKIALGAALLGCATPALFPRHPLLAMWVAGAGYLFVLHFGVFHALSLFWRTRNVLARPIMNAPLLSRTLSELWGARWNTAFSTLANDYIVRPCAPIRSVNAAMMLTYVISGLVHELLISIPARAGYGLPTMYFVVQGLGVQLQRSALGKSLCVSRGAGARLFTILVAAVPAYWLFHPEFMNRVFAPFLCATGVL